MSKTKENQSIPAIKTRQWLKEWDNVEWTPKDRRARPKEFFHIFSISATDLRKLSGVYSRTTKRKSSKEDLGIQRRLEPERSKEIEKFVRFGYPWSNLSEKKRESGEFKDLRNPGWLPTAIVINILDVGDIRKGVALKASDSIQIEQIDKNLSKIALPSTFDRENWKYDSIPPIEIIDGQHRLWAFEELELDEEFQLPVVAFSGLDLSWQAYLFYTINIKPKRINASLAFDLYPMLRTEEWLTKFEGHAIYKEARAQEIVDLLWSHPESPWNNRINMLGETGLKGKMVTQAAWIRSLLASYIRSSEGPNVKIGGLYGAPVGENEITLSWRKCDQAAFIMVVGAQLKKAILNSKEVWNIALTSDELDLDTDAGFHGNNSLLNQDQGIRVFLQITNDIFFVLSDFLELDSIGTAFEAEEEEIAISNSIKNINKNKAIFKFIEKLCIAISEYDWRASSSPGLTDSQKLLKAAFRGSGGYKELRKSVLSHLSKSDDNQVASASSDVAKMLRIF